MFDSEEKMILKRLKKYNKTAYKNGVSTDEDEWRIVKFEDNEVQIEITSMTRNDNYPVPTLIMKPATGNYPVSIILSDPYDPSDTMELCEASIIAPQCKTIKECLDQVASWLIDNAM